MSDIEFKRPFRLSLYKPRDARGFSELIGVSTYTTEQAARERLTKCVSGGGYKLEVKKREPNRRGRMHTVIHTLAMGRT